VISIDFSSFCLAELNSVPVGTGTLYVLSPSSSSSSAKTTRGSRRGETDSSDGEEGDEGWTVDAMGHRVRRQGRRTKPRRRTPLAAGKLRKEKRAVNSTEREEAYAVQYLTLGGHRTFTTKNKERPGRTPNRAASFLHAGAGQQVFGWGPQQKSDLMLSFLPETEREPARLYFHNHHGAHWHY